MEPHFNRVTIIGVGLLGASLGLALKSRGLATEIYGVGHRQSSLDTALRMGAVDAVFLNAAEAVKGADLIVLATPAALVIPKLDEIREACPAQAIVTDVASTKQAICDHARATWPAPRRFVGSHPMAGSEKFGAEHGRPNLYEAAVCLVETGPDLDAAARDTVVSLWRAVGALVVDIAPAVHDAALARTSHIPHVIASALAMLAARHGEVRPFIGPGFRDMTRIAASRPEIWRDICITNREAMLEGLRELNTRLEAFAEAIKKADAAALESLFQEGHDARRAMVDE